jgi:hypothetical protein
MTHLDDRTVAARSEAELVEMTNATGEIWDVAAGGTSGEAAGVRPGR